MKNSLFLICALFFIFSVRIGRAGLFTQSGTALQSCISVVIPNGSTGIQFQLTMTSGDWDLYVNLPGNGCPTTSSFDCRSWNGGTSAEDCGSYTAPNSCGSGNSTYRVLIDPYDLSGTWTLTVTWADCGGPPANDNCTGATILPLDECNWTTFILPKEATNSGVAVPSCLQPGGLGSCGTGSILEDIWYRFTANSSTTVVEVFNNNRHMAIQVYSGSCGSLTPVSGGCSDNCPAPSNPVLESVSISTNPGQIYYVRLMRTNSDGLTNDMDGTIRAYSSSSHANQGVFGTVTANNSRGSAPNLTLNGSPNTCADVGTLRTGRIEVRSLGTATRDNSIADQSCFLVGQTTSSNRNVWARVTIPSGSSINGLYFYSTIEGVCPQPSSSTNLRTGYINVYTGTSSCTPNSPCGGAWDNIITSYNFSAPYIETQGTERIDVVPGQTYYIEIWTTSFGNDPNFNFDVHVVPLGNPPGNENCNNALAFSGSGVGCNLGADPACTGYTIPCMATVENSVFYTYESPGTPFQIEVENVVCEGGAQDLQAGIFEMNAGTCLGNLTGSNLVGSACFTGNYSFDINAPLPAGSDYLIWFDGNAGAACTWGLTILPIEFKDYSVTCDDDGVIFNWSTYSEHNNDFFSIEVSSDGSIFETIGIMDAIGNSISQSDYSMRFDSPQRGNWYYRLSQTDFDGKKTILGTLSSEWPCKDGDNEPYLFPNPARDEVNVLFESNGRSTYSVEVFNSLGQLVLPSISGEFKGNGQKMIKVATNDLSAGSFIVRIMEGEKMYTRLLILE